LTWLSTDCLTTANSYTKTLANLPKIKTSTDATVAQLDVEIAATQKSMAEAALKNEGTHFYKGEWGALDQFIGSWSLVESTKGLRAPIGSQHRFFDDLVVFRDKEGQARPNRTYVGDSYKNGYSDHLAIYLHIQL
jgi:hypothetical protein